MIKLIFFNRELNHLKINNNMDLINENIKSSELEDEYKSFNFQQLLELVKKLKQKNKYLEYQINILQVKNFQSIVEKLNKEIPWVVEFIEWVNKLSDHCLNIEIDIDNEKLFKFSDLNYEIIKSIFNKEREFYYPILKYQNKLFITSANGWQELDNPTLIKFLQKIENILITKLTNWKKENVSKLINEKNCEKINTLLKNILQISHKTSTSKNNLIKCIKPIPKFNNKK